MFSPSAVCWHFIVFPISEDLPEKTRSRDSFTPLLELIYGILLAFVVFLYFFHIEDIRVQCAMTGVVTCLIGSVLFLIVILNDPFTGQVHVSKYPFEHALLQFDALNIQPP